MYEHTVECQVCGKVFTYESTMPTPGRAVCTNCITARRRHKKHITRTTRPELTEGIRCEAECQRCGKSFVYYKKGPTGYKRRYCPECKDLVVREAGYESRLKGGHIEKPGVGSGAHGRGAENRSYVNGSGIYRRDFLASVPEDERVCAGCGCPQSLWYKLDVHHLDGDHYNNDPANWILLCRSCHKKLHAGTLSLAEVKSRINSGNPIIDGQSDLKAVLAYCHGQRLEGDARCTLIIPPRGREDPH